MMGWTITRVAGLALGLAVAAPFAGQASAQGLVPQVAQPLMQLINAAGQQCQMGNAQGCALANRLQQAGNELAQAQFACQQGNPQACQIFQAGAAQVAAAWQQAFGGGGYVQAPNSDLAMQQQALAHQQRMQDRQAWFQMQQQQVHSRGIDSDREQQRALEMIRR